ncbi:MAG: adenosylcobinamide-GDP ribazoletransferase [Pseudomonadota bacterium]
MSPEQETPQTTETGVEAKPPAQSLIRQRFEEALLAVMLLTRIPLPPVDIKTRANLASSVWAFPLVGSSIGCVGALAVWLAQSATLGPWPAAVIAIGIMIMLTGAFHEDGLADFWDGIGGGRTKSKKLAIMRDSQIGTYGVLALILAVASTGSAIAQLSSSPSQQPVTAGLILAGSLSRAAILLPLHILKPARQDGLAASLAPPSWAMTAFVSLTVIAVGGLLVDLQTLLVCVLVGTIGALGITGLASRYLGGHTGDVLGAVVVTTFSAVLLTAAACL